MLVFQLYIILVKKMYTVCNAYHNHALVTSPHDNLLCELVFIRNNAFINIMSLEKILFHASSRIINFDVITDI